MQKFYILDSNMIPVECSETEHLNWVSRHGHIPVLATIGPNRFQIVADMRKPFDSPPEFEVRKIRADGISKTVSRHEKYTHALLSVLDELYEPDKPTEPQKKSYVAWKDDDVVPATLDEAMDWIIENPNNEHNERTHGDWTTVIDFDVDDLSSGLPFALQICNEYRIHSRIFFPTFLDAVRAQTKFHKKLEAIE